MKPGEAAASTRSGGGTVAFSWEEEPGVSKQSPADAKKKPTAGAPRAEPVSRRTLPAAAKKAPASPAAATAARQHRLRVPPPPGGPGAPAVSPSREKSGSRRRRSRGVTPRDDPFLAAYLACCSTEKGSNGKGAHNQKLLGWAGLGLGLGLGLRGLGLSCKTSCGAVEECVVRMARIPELDED